MVRYCSILWTDQHLQSYTATYFPTSRVKIICLSNQMCSVVMCHLMQQDYVFHSFSTTTVKPRYSATNFGFNLWRYFEGGHK
jgi:hypothetical protein